MSGDTANLFTHVLGTTQMAYGPLATFLAPVIVGVLTGWWAHRWNSRHDWLTSEYERRAEYYSQVNRAGLNLTGLLPSLLSDFKVHYNTEGDSDGASLEHGTVGAVHGLSVSAGEPELAATVIREWREIAINAGSYSSGVGITAIRGADVALFELLQALDSEENWNLVESRATFTQERLQLMILTLSRDMVDLRRIALKALPRRQRRAERASLRQESKNLESQIGEALARVTVMTDWFNSVDQ